MQEFVDELQTVRDNISQVVREVMADFRQPSLPTADTTFIGLEPEHIGYFNPDAPDDGTGISMETDITIFTDVFIFTSRLRHRAAIHGEALIRLVWDRCLLGSALVWHLQILTAAERLALHTASIEVVATRLEKDFCPDHASAFARLTKARYTLWDAFQNKDMMIFVIIVVRNAKACGMNDHAQLISAFEAFDGPIQMVLGFARPTVDTTLEQFTMTIKNCGKNTLAQGKEYQARTGSG
ncbi:unnamed protein product [Parascedosporium putredinis]|uniref:Uncharacterized protein n=1 Tax=Parascedosporium putredinis TaxID=1442378 RepID=A0A9P1GVY6_9PEZI|nr:unnamed protein product [Parascedosporium putredinis]CAI7988372.1 unnamed protein product [Parascedosporium putredinis]